jgi:hypothetical protein
MVQGMLEIRPRLRTACRTSDVGARMGARHHTQSPASVLVRVLPIARLVVETEAEAEAEVGVVLAATEVVGAHCWSRSVQRSVFVPAGPSRFRRRAIE